MPPKAKTKPTEKKRKHCPCLVFGSKANLLKTKTKQSITVPSLNISEFVEFLLIFHSEGRGLIMAKLRFCIGGGGGRDTLFTYSKPLFLPYYW